MLIMCFFIGICFVLSLSLSHTHSFIVLSISLPLWHLLFSQKLSSWVAVTHKKMIPAMIKRTWSFPDLSNTPKNADGFTQTFPHSLTRLFEKFLPGYRPAFVSWMEWKLCAGFLYLFISGRCWTSLLITGPDWELPNVTARNMTDYKCVQKSDRVEQYFCQLHQYQHSDQKQRYRCNF